MSDILERAKRGDKKAYEIIIKEYEKIIINIAYRMLGNIEDAKDVSQDVCIKIYKNIYKCTNALTLKNWICKIARNTCIDELRKRKDKINTSIDMLIEDDEKRILINTLKSSEPDPVNILVEKESQKIFQRALNELSPEQKELIILRDFEKLSYQEISEVISAPMGTVKSRISRARNSLVVQIKKMQEQIID